MDTLYPITMQIPVRWGKSGLICSSEFVYSFPANHAYAIERQGLECSLKDVLDHEPMEVVCKE